VSICLSVTSQYCVETTGRIELVFDMDASFHLSHTSCCKEIWVSRKITVLHSRTLSQTPDLEETISPRQVDSVVNKTRRRHCRRSSLLTTIGQSTSRGCLLQLGQLQPSNSITSIFLWICWTTLFVHLTRFCLNSASRLRQQRFLS